MNDQNTAGNFAETGSILPAHSVEPVVKNSGNASNGNGAKVDDRRVRRTKKALRQGLATLLAEKNIKDITVRELTELVDLNRATFYLHYRDIYELQDHIENDVIEEIDAIVTQFMPAMEGDRPYLLFAALLDYIAENDKLCRMLMGKNNSRSFLDKLCGLVEDRCLHSWLGNYERSGCPEKLSYFSVYIVYGYVAVISKWVDSDMRISPGEMAKMLEGMGKYGIGYLNKA